MSTPFIGEIRLFGFGRVPIGWKACDGSVQPISDYPTLFTLIGTTYGGDGESTFGLPDLRGQIPLHWGQGPGLSAYTPGEFGGSEHITLVPSQMPAHTHGFLATTAAASSGTPSASVELGALSGDTMYVTDLAGTTPAAMSASSTSATGGTQPHDNLMPTLTLQYCIATDGIFPQHN